MTASQAVQPAERRRELAPVFGVDLAALRRERGWSHCRLIGALRAAAGEVGQQLPADAHLKRSLARWEKGQTGVSEFYAELFGAVFGRRFLPGHPPVLAVLDQAAEESAGAGPAGVDVAEVRRRLDAMAVEIATLSRVLADAVAGSAR